MRTFLMLVLSLSMLQPISLEETTAWPRETSCKACVRITQTEVQEGLADLVDLVGLDGQEFQGFQVHLMSHYLQYNNDNDN